jgi:hypothetical protein
MSIAALIFSLYLQLRLTSPSCCKSRLSLLSYRLEHLNSGELPSFRLHAFSSTSTAVSCRAAGCVRKESMVGLGGASDQIILFLCSLLYIPHAIFVLFSSDCRLRWCKELGWEVLKNGLKWCSVSGHPFATHSTVWSDTLNPSFLEQNIWKFV